MATKPAPAKAAAKTMGTKTAAAKSAKNARSVTNSAPAPKPAGRSATATNAAKTPRAVPKNARAARAPANKIAGPGMVYDKRLHRSVPIASGAGEGKSVRQAKATA